MKSLVVMVTQWAQIMFKKLMDFHIGESITYFVETYSGVCGSIVK